ncbi:hypothetical protein N7470_003836 [Penicillium chermesinum]|nr:hypothetical protein N7470_003836 [Penicillium chermesinum]
MCYVSGSAFDLLLLKGGFDVNQTIDNIKSDTMNVTSIAYNGFKNYTEPFRDLLDHDLLPKFLPFPTLDLDLNLQNVSSLEGTKAAFRFDNLELYLDLDIVLPAGATYTLTMFESEETFFQVSDPFASRLFDIGTLYSIELILIADAEVELKSGIHTKFDEGLIFVLDAFDGEVSNVTIPGGQYELLPITIEGKGSIQALLNVKATLAVGTSNLDIDGLGFLAGVEADVVANVADFLLNVNESSRIEDGDCEVPTVAEYTIALGAAVGAAVALQTYVWGPTPDTTTPVFYTTLPSICAATKPTSALSSTITPNAALDARADWTTMVAPSGSSATWPESTYTSVTSAIPFGKDVRKLGATSGVPTSYDPSAPTKTSTGVADSGTKGTNDKLIIRLSVGLGVPVLAALVGGIG